MAAPFHWKINALIDVLFFQSLLMDKKPVLVYLKFLFKLVS